MKQENKNKIEVTANVASIFKNENGNEARVMKALVRNGIKTICDLCLRSENDLLAIKNVGQASVSEIASRLDQYGLRLGMTEEELTSYAQQTSEQISTEQPSEEQPSDDSAAPPSMSEFVNQICEDLEQKRMEARHFELARDIYLRDTEVFSSNEERAVDAIRKASEFMEVYFKN